MIPRDYITAWRPQAPWVQDFQVEQDLALSRALVEMFSHPVLADGLAFRGGTALHKLHLQPAARYSEDLDLVQVRPGPAGPIMKALRETLDPWLGTPGWKQTKGRVLAHGHLWDMEHARQRVEAQLAALLPGETWKGVL